MAKHEDESEIAIETGNLPAAPSRSIALQSYTGESHKVATAAPGQKLYGCTAVSICFLGLLCISQAALNICLRLALSSTPGIDATCKNLTDDILKRINFGKSCTEEQEELKIKLTNFVKAVYFQHGWVDFNSSLYYISSIKKTWQESRDDCLQRGGDLVIINSKGEQEFASQYQKIMWIGLSKREAAAEWTWVDGTALTTSFWQSHEPNNHRGNEDCVEITHSINGYWNDAACENKNFWICKKKMEL
uniref:CD209 antigen-like protein C isoform X2 n=1 Tax=Scatophagus argus TaxID=75038 RepID=UPI001ED7CD4D|nr:CD209 antigen-like protein C isoform X2 [Scatophagus argus]